MRNRMKRLSRQSYIRVFYNEGPFVHPPGEGTASLPCLPHEDTRLRAEPKDLRQGKGETTAKASIRYQA